MLRSDAGKLYEIASLLLRARQPFGTFDILFLNACFGLTVPFEDITENDFNDIVAVTLKYDFL